MLFRSLVTDVCYSQDGNTILSASKDDTVRFWNANDGTPVGVLRRHESLWDPVRSYFVSIAPWWPDPSWRSFTTQALIYSANPLYVQDDGWIRALDGGLLLWIPWEHRVCSCHSTSESTVTTNPHDERLKKSPRRDLPRWADIVKLLSVEDSH